MSVALRLALRDLRRGGRGLLLLALCLFLGTAALAGIGSLSASMLAALDAQGRTILGGDVELTVSQRSATVAETATFADAGRLSATIGMRAMADAGGTTAPTLVSLRGVDAAWPLVGRLTLAPGGQRPRGRQVAVAQALADRLSLRVGSPPADRRGAIDGVGGDRGRTRSARRGVLAGAVGVDGHGTRCRRRSSSSRAACTKAATTSCCRPVPTPMRRATG